MGRDGPEPEAAKLYSITSSARDSRDSGSGQADRLYSLGGTVRK
jgi:hypothetical protein